MEGFKLFPMSTTRSVLTVCETSHTHTLLFTLQVKVCYLRSVCVFSTNPVFSWQTVELHLTAAGSVGEIHIRPSFLFLPVHSCIVTSDIWNRRQTFTTMTHSLTTEQFFVKNCTSYKKNPPENCTFTWVHVKCCNFTPVFFSLLSSSWIYTFCSIVYLGDNVYYMYVHVLPVESSSWQTDFLQERSLDLHTTKQNKHRNTDLPFISVFIDPPKRVTIPSSATCRRAQSVWSAPVAGTESDTRPAKQTRLMMLRRHSVWP